METFSNVPVEAGAVIRSLPPRMRLPDLRYFAGAGILIDHYLGRSLAADIKDPFMRFDPELVGEGNWQFAARVTQIAEILFSLRNQPGFGEICRRMRSRDLRSAYGELASAAMIMRHGFTIQMRPEIGQKTRDFDFAATRTNLTANVEVWTLDQSNFDANRLLRRLKDKRKQLPGDAPAVITCVFPEVWFEQVDRLYDQFDSIADRFFGGSRRINWLFFAHEEFDAVPPFGGNLWLRSYPIPHSNPRHAAVELDLALSTPPSSQGAMDLFSLQPRGPWVVQTQDEFHRWINMLVQG